MFGSKQTHFYLAVMHNTINERHLCEQNSDLRIYFPGLPDSQVNTDHLREMKAELPDP